MLFSLLVNVKTPTIVGILTFMSRNNFILRHVEHEIFITSGSDTKLCNAIKSVEYFKINTSYLHIGLTSYQLLAASKPKHEILGKYTPTFENFICESLRYTSTAC